MISFPRNISVAKLTIFRLFSYSLPFFAYIHLKSDKTAAKFVINPMYISSTQICQTLAVLNLFGNWTFASRNTRAYRRSIKRRLISWLCKGPGHQQPCIDLVWKKYYGFTARLFKICWQLYKKQQQNTRRDKGNLSFLMTFWNTLFSTNSCCLVS